MFKKIVIADNLAYTVNMVYGNPENFYGIQLIIGTIFFSFQIYCDFSGYSDIAIGIARVLGFNLMKNFDFPYFSKSFREFWRRWHISLSSWFRDYLYISLGGNRVATSRWIYNLFITFLISGLWHGAKITFIIWGAVHGVCVIIESLISKFNKKEYIIPTFLKTVFVFIMVCLAWIFFRANSFSDVEIIFKNIVHTTNTQPFLSLFPSVVFLYKLMASFLLFMIIEIVLFRHIADKNFLTLPKTVRFAAYYILIFWIIFFGMFDIAPGFIYFQF